MRQLQEDTADGSTVSCRAHNTAVNSQLVDVSRACVVCGSRRLDNIGGLSLDRAASTTQDIIWFCFAPWPELHDSRDGHEPADLQSFSGERCQENFRAAYETDASEA